jgi:hypothetical protein
MHLILAEMTEGERKIAFKHPGIGLEKCHQDRAVYMIVWQSIPWMKT